MAANRTQVQTTVKAFTRPLSFPPHSEVGRLTRLGKSTILQFVVTSLTTQLSLYTALRAFFMEEVHNLS